MLSEIKDMWDGHLSGINALRHRADFTSPNAGSTQYVQYHTELCMRKFEGDEMDLMLLMTVFQSAPMKCAAPEVFARRRIELSASASIIKNAMQSQSGTLTLFKR